MRVQSDEFHTMSWDEFSDLVSGLNEQTPLIRVAQIRLENDPERLKHFTKEQRKMNADWKRKRAMSKPREDVDNFMAQMQEGLKKMFGGE